MRRKTAPPKAGSFWNWFSWWPISRAQQAIMAEALGQCLASGLPLPQALSLVSRTIPHPRLCSILRHVGSSVCAGQGVAEAFVRTRVRFRKDFVAALRVGHEHNCLAQELRTFARKVASAPDRALARTLGRGEEAARFAAALSRLLAKSKLSMPVVESAGQLAANGNKQFLRAINHITQGMAEGVPFPKALMGHPRHFDPMFCHLLDSAQTREQVRFRLQLLGEPSS